MTATAGTGISRRRRNALSTYILVLVGVVVFATNQCDAQAAPPSVRDHRTLWLKDLHRGDEIRVRPFGQHGKPRRREWLKLTRFLRDRHGHRRTVHPHLLRVLAQVQRHFGGRELHLMSGYRAPVDPHALSSHHQVGHAADIWMRISPKVITETGPS